MSDLASAQLLQASAAQLPVYTYFDPAYYAQEQRLLFGDAPIYYGHELMTPNAGDYQTLDWMGHGKMLKNVDGRIKLISMSAVTARPSFIKVAATATISSAICTAGPMTPRAPCWARRISRKRRA